MTFPPCLRPYGPPPPTSAGRSTSPQRPSDKNHSQRNSPRFRAQQGNQTC